MLLIKLYVASRLPEHLLVCKRGDTNGLTTIKLGRDSVFLRPPVRTHG